MLVLRRIARRDIGRFRRRLPVADRHARDPASPRSCRLRAASGRWSSEPAMLSKPRAESSGGRSVVASISRSSRSRTALAYSVRLRRCRTTEPGLACAAALRSISASSQSRSPSYSGKGRPADSRRGHQAGAQFAHDLFPHLGVVAHAGEIQFLERKIGRLGLVVMAGDAVLIEKSAFRGSRGDGGCLRRGLSRSRSVSDDAADQSHSNQEDHATHISNKTTRGHSKQDSGGDSPSF